MKQQYNQLQVSPGIYFDSESGITSIILYNQVILGWFKDGKKGFDLEKDSPSTTNVNDPLKCNPLEPL